MGDASLIDQQRTVLETLEARVRQLKSEGRSLEQVQETLTSEFQDRYTDWTAPDRIGRAVQSWYGELP
jgi:chaperonin cofactor prefoldin